MPLNERLRKAWKAAGYHRGSGSDAVVPPPEVGFKRLYYLTGPDHGISDIVFNRLKISRFSELNDPFEVLGANFSNRALREVVRNHKEELNRKYGLVCFSDDWVDPVLWSHYAEKHSGIALGFDVRESLAKRVSYQPARLKAKLPDGATTITVPLAEILISTKFESWKYEREWRILAALGRAEQEGLLYFMPFSKQLKLAEVILGPACSLPLARVRDLVNTHHSGVTTFAARLAYRSFRVIPKGSTVQRV